MGYDTHIHVRAKRSDPHIGDFFENLVPVEGHYCQPEATHVVDVGERYWSPDYPRGSWPYIASVLMPLLRSDQIEKVWYGNETGSEEMTVELLNEYTAEYVKGRVW
jgi:hypothetical protein